MALILWTITNYLTNAITEKTIITTQDENESWRWGHKKSFSAKRFIFCRSIRNASLKGAFKNGENKKIQRGHYGPGKKYWYGMRFKSTYFRILTQKGWHHFIQKAGIQQVRINNISYKITKMNLLFTHLLISGQYCVHVETSQLISRGYWAISFHIYRILTWNS